MKQDTLCSDFVISNVDECCKNPNKNNMKIRMIMVEQIILKRVNTLSFNSIYPINACKLNAIEMTANPLQPTLKSIK